MPVSLSFSFALSLLSRWYSPDRRSKFSGLMASERERMYLHSRVRSGDGGKEGEEKL
jgi:hypothetical protein